MAVGPPPDNHGTTAGSRFITALLQLLARLVGPIGVLILGGLLLSVVCILGLISAVSRPPVRITMRPAANAEYHVRCDCGLQVTVSEGSAGAVVECGCGQSIQVPSRRELQALAEKRQ